MARRTETKTKVIEEEEEYEIAVCDFCNQDYPEKDPDEFLNRILVNPPTELTGMVPLSDRGYGYDRVEHVIARLDFLEMRRKAYERIDEIDFATGPPPKKSSSFETSRRYGMEVRIDLSGLLDYCTMEVCDYCVDSFR